MSCATPKPCATHARLVYNSKHDNDYIHPKQITEVSLYTR